MKKFKLISNSKGLTLVEVLAVIVVLSIISSLVFRIISNAQQTHNQQGEINKEVTDAAINFKQLNLDIRKADEVLCTTATGDAFSTEYSDTGQIISYNYSSSDNTLYKDSQPFITNVHTFTLACTTIGTKTYTDAIEIGLSTDNSVSSKIVVRSGNR